MRTAAELLSHEGPFAVRSGFAPRPGQQRLAEAIESALKQGGTLVAEAATGIGKTWAYLVPALESGRRVVISTGTKNLQEQLFHRDLPAVQEALGRRRRVALLKGRANYLCHYRLERARAQGEHFSARRADALESLNAWSRRTQSGDIAEAHWLPEGDSLWPQVTSTTDNCLGGRCPFFDECFVYKARHQAQAADVVVVNHDLLFAALALRRDGVEELLPEADAYVIDEAHKVPATAAQHFGAALGSGQVRSLAEDVLAEAGDVSGALAALESPREELIGALNRLGAELAELEPRGEWPPESGGDQACQAAADLEAALEEMAGALAPLAEASPGLENCLRRTRALVSLLQRLSSDETGWVHWYELRGKGFGINGTPLSVSAPFSDLRGDNSAWVFTSATLTVAGRFEHFCEQLGLDAPETLSVASGFDYRRNGLLYLPARVPVPGRGGYDAQALVAACAPVLEASDGRAFMLFTSHRALRRAARLLSERLDHPLFVQGEAPRSRLLEEFRASGNGVLLGTRSFWEGVDVAGSALSVVIIDRLPFESPADPVFRMRERALREAGRHPFMEWQLPTAVITLKQGAGRLIRQENDRGVLMICDPRIRTRPYGRVFLDSLPPMRVTDSLDEVREFLHQDAPRRRKREGGRPE